MFWWQWSLLLLVAVLALWGFTMPPKGRFGNGLRIVLAWFLPYALITAGLCTLYIQGIFWGGPYILLAYFLYASFVHRNFG